MDLTDSVSAIDDSYEPIHFPSARASGCRPGGPPITQENSGYHGPRSGHWAVKYTVFGSSIDNGGPTVHHFPATKYDVPGHVQPMAGELIKRLAKAAEEQKEVALNDCIWSIAKTDSEEQIQKPAQNSEKPPLPKGFFVPRTDLRGIRITSKDGKNEVVKAPQIVTGPAKAETKQSGREIHLKEEQAPAPSPPISIKSQKAPTAISPASQQSKRAVRIAGRNGEEVFMYLPVIPLGSKAACKAPPAAKEQASEEDKTQTTKYNPVEKAHRDSNAAKIAKRLREERAVQNQVDEQRAQDAKVAAQALMSGALPTSSKASSAGKVPCMLSARSSGKDSGVAFGGMFDTNTSKPPSVASSRTSVPRSHGAVSAKSSHQSSWGPQSVKSAVRVSSEARSEHSKAQSKSGWQHVGSGTLHAPKQKGSPHTASLVSWQANSETPPHSPVFREEEPTIFAGHGWISPHPLSIAPSEFERPPDPVIELPPRNVAKEGVKIMTYDEWRSIQRSSRSQSVSVKMMKGGRERRNFSRSSSDAHGYEGGSWGFRGAGGAESRREEGWGSVGGYRSPRVESVRSDGGGTYEHDFDGAWEGEEDGRTRLKMPWDDEVAW